MSNVTPLKLAPPPDLDVATEARVHLCALMADALSALARIDAGDYSSADTALKDAMKAAHDCRAALLVKLEGPTPKAQVDAALREWTL